MPIRRSVALVRRGGQFCYVFCSLPPHTACGGAGRGALVVTTDESPPCRLCGTLPSGKVVAEDVEIYMYRARAGDAGGLMRRARRGRIEGFSSSLRLTGAVEWIDVKHITRSAHDHRPTPHSCGPQHMPRKSAPRHRQGGHHMHEAVIVRAVGRMTDQYHDRNDHAAPLFAY